MSAEVNQAIVEQIEESPSSGKRRMPDNLRRFLLKLQGGKLYLPAAYRIVWFRDEEPRWTLQTDLVEGGHGAGFATVRATIRDESGRVMATAHKTETKQDFPAGWVEKAESGSISRALGFCGFGTAFMPELDEEGHVSDSPQDPRGNNQEARPPASQASAIWEGPGQCPACHAPEGKRHGKPCFDRAALPLEVQEARPVPAQAAGH